MNSEHEIFMLRCFELARLGEGLVAPNPMVGAVLVFDNKIIGEGYHQKFGKAHAEINCINSVKEEDKKQIEKSTLYVSLEPCAHFGKSPPCVDAILKYKIPKVVISVKDNYAEVNGKGIKRMRDNGIEVITDILKDKGEELNKHFFHFNSKKRPFITLKFAQTKDKYIGIENKQIQISNELSKRLVHKIRSQHQGILVGKKTILTDNPKLDIRYWVGKNPVRIVLSEKEAIPSEFNINNEASETLYINNKSIEDVLKTISGRSITSVLVEGGATVLNKFIEENLWDEAIIITSEEYLNNGINAPEINGTIIEEFQIGNNLFQRLKNTNDLSHT